MSCTATSLIATAMANGYAGLSDRDLKMALVAAACAGGGGSGGGVTCGAGAPVAAPASGCGLYIDSNTGTLYEYYDSGGGGTWH